MALSAIDGVETIPTRNGLQLDHVLASTEARERLAVHHFELDAAWTGPGAASLSDHTGLWFSLDLA